MLLVGQNGDRNVRLALNVRVQVTVYVITRRRTQILVVAAEIINSGCRPPKRKRVRVVGELFAAIEVLGLEQRLGVVKLLSV